MEVIDLNEEETKEEIISEENLEIIEDEKPKKLKKKNVFVRFKNYISSLSKKKKIILGISLFLLIVIIILLCIFIFKEEEVEEVFEEQPVILSMDNYKYVDGILYFYDSEEVELGSYECLVKDETLCYLAMKEEDFSLDNVVKVYSDYSQISSYVQIYSSLVFVSDDESLLLYNMDESEVVGEYSLVYPAYDNYVIVSDLTGKYAIIDLTEGYELITSFEYDYIGYIDETEKFVFLKNSDYGIMDSSGKELIDDVSGIVTNYDENYIVSQSGSTYSLYSYDNDCYLSGYDFIKLYDGYVYAIMGNEMYVFDSHFNKINEEAIEILEIEEYTDYAIYSDSHILSSTEYIIDFEKLSDKTLKIEGTSYNIYESLVNENIAYANYILGTWYFYSDEEKTNLTGTYDCDVLNSVSSSSDSYSSCYVANNTDLRNSSSSVTGTTPILYNNYVFMYDTQSLAVNDSVILYDLANETELKTYSAVDLISLESFSSDIEFVDSEMTILVQSTDGLLGIITINSSGASKLIDYDYVSYSTLNSYYVFTDSSGNNFLFQDNGDCINPDSKIKNIILDYTGEYLIVSVNGNKQMYGVDGTIVSDAYETIMLESDVYLGKNGDNSIYLYRYDDTTTNYFADGIDTEYSYLSFYQSGDYAYVKLFDEENLEVDSFSVYIGVE